MPILLLLSLAPLALQEPAPSQTVVTAPRSTRTATSPLTQVTVVGRRLRSVGGRGRAKEGIQTPPESTPPR